MKIKIDYNKCTKCEKCIDICPVNVIKNQGKIIIDNSRCILCRMCVVECPTNALTLK